MSMVSDKEIKEALEIIDEMLEGNEKEKQKGSAHAFRKFPFGMGHEQYNLLKKMVKILTSQMNMVSCPLCNEEFESEELLQKHMITHDNV